MNKKIRWIIIGIVAVIIIAISIMAIINEVQLHYKVEEISEYKYFTLEQNQKYGVIDRNGNIVIEASYTEANNFSDGLALVKSRDVICTGTDRFDGYGYINVKGELVIPFEYYYMSTDFKDGSACVYDTVDNVFRAWYACFKGG